MIDRFSNDIRFDILFQKGLDKHGLNCPQCVYAREGSQFQSTSYASLDKEERNVGMNATALERVAVSYRNKVKE